MAVDMAGVDFQKIAAEQAKAEGKDGEMGAGMAAMAAGILETMMKNMKVETEFRPDHTIHTKVAIDGADHFTAAGQERDRVRDEFLSQQGYRVVRISGYEVLRAGNEVLELIREEVARRMQELRVEEK